MLTFGTPGDVWTNTSYVADVVIALSAIVAVRGYIYQKKKDKTDAVIKLLEFTREKIIPLSWEIVKEIMRVHSLTFQNILFVRIDVFDLEIFKRAHPRVAEQQTRIYYTLSNGYLPNVSSLANLLEEFALRALNQDAKGNKAMESIMPIFVNAVERMVMYILLESLSSGNGTFPGIRQLYLEWRDAPCIARNTSLTRRDAAVFEILRLSTSTPNPRLVQLP